MIHIPVQILSSAKEFESFIYDCVLSLRKQIGVGERYRLTVNIATYEPVTDKSRNKVLELSDQAVSINLININRSCGYGEKQNQIWAEYTRNLKLPFDVFVTMNPDIVLMPDVIDKMYNTFRNNIGANIVEARQFPIENPPRDFDPETLEVNWCSGACILISAAFFERSGGFDEAIYLYCEDVDLSWRAWLDGGKCLYCFDAIVAHMTRGLFEARYNPHSVPVHEESMALSHLILTWKYFSASESMFNAKMNLFWSNEWIVQHTKEAAMQKFEILKPRLRRYSVLNPNIQIVDLGLYSSMRQNMI